MALAASGAGAGALYCQLGLYLCTLMCTLSPKTAPALFRHGALVLVFIGDPGWIRTSDPQLRRLVLYPTELRGLAWRKVYPRRGPIERCALGNLHGPRPRR